MASHDSAETLHYVDPPYVLATRGLKNPYCKKGYKFEMTDDQHRELAQFLRELTGMVVVSGYDCPLYSEIYAGWRTVRRRALADGAREREEVLWLSPAVPAVSDLFDRSNRFLDDTRPEGS